MSLALLPAELLDAIFEPLPPATLAALACTSPNLYPSATRLLYRHLALSSYARNLSALHTLATRSHLCRLVRSFSISLDEDPEQNGSRCSALFSEAVRGMSDLTSLEVLVDPGHSWVLTPATASSHPNLEHFACSFPLDAHVVRFLEGSPALQSLQVGPSPDSAELRSTVIPHLTTYTGPASLLGTLLPSRPITSLFLSGDLTLADIELLAQASSAPTALPHKLPEAAYPASDALPANASVKTLSAITSALPVAVIEALTRACPELVSLRLITTCAFWETPDMSLYAQIANFLSALPSLSVFELSGMHWEFRPKSAPIGDASCPEKEWVSPPVSPRPVDMDDGTPLDAGFDFDEAFQDWAY